MADVLVKWNTQIVQHPAGSEEADHFHIGLGVVEADEPLTSTEHLFPSVQPGTYEGHGEVIGKDGSELQTPVVFTAVVPEAPTVSVPIIVDMSGTAK